MIAQHGAASFLAVRSPELVCLERVAGTEWVGLDVGTEVSTEAKSLTDLGLGGPLAGKVLSQQFIIDQQCLFIDCCSFVVVLPVL